jgi:hypothetical protein
MPSSVFQGAHHANLSRQRTGSYAKVIADSRRVRWDIEDDVLRGRRFDLSKPCLSGLSLAGGLPFLQRGDRRYASPSGLKDRTRLASLLASISFLLSLLLTGLRQ